jgi:tetratricopeptide (TPR) repeat protein
MSDAKPPQKLAEEGKSAYKNGDFSNAASLFEAARQGYQAASDPLMAAEMANNASVAYLQGEDAQAALNAVEGTPAIFAEASDLRRQGMALGNYAAALEGLERNDEAADFYQQSADVLELAGESELRANVLQSLSSLQFRTGRQLQALASMQAGLDGIEKPNPRQRLLKRLLKIPFNMINKNQKKIDQ